MSFLTLFALFSGVAARVLFVGTSFSTWVMENTEVNTPQTSWKRVSESFALINEGISPYSGDLFHEMPILMYTMKFLNNLLRSRIYLFFIICDVITAFVLGSLADIHGTYLLKKQASKIKKYSLGTEELILKAADLKLTKTFVLLAYLLNPYTVMTCVARSTTCFHNLILALTLLSIFKGSRVAGCIFVALASYFTFYPIMLVVPLCMYVAQLEQQKSASRAGSSGATWGQSVVRTCLGTLVILALLMYISFQIEGKWKFLSSTWGFILLVPDLNPNIGVFWYFFTEMFDHFFIFYIFVFQINVFLYTAPLAIRYRDHPLFVAYVLVALIAIFKSYPCYGDVALYLALLPLWRHSYAYLRNSFVVSVMFAVSGLLAPTLYYLWIYSGSANSNFYFAITLVYTSAQIFLVSDILYAFTRREFHLYHGLKAPEFDGKPGVVLLD